MLGDSYTEWEIRQPDRCVVGTGRHNRFRSNHFYGDIASRTFEYGNSPCLPIARFPRIHSIASNGWYDLGENATICAGLDTEHAMESGNCPVRRSPNHCDLVSTCHWGHTFVSDERLKKRICGVAKTLSFSPSCGGRKSNDHPRYQTGWNARIDRTQ